MIPNTIDAPLVVRRVPSRRTTRALIAAGLALLAASWWMTHRLGFWWPWEGP